MITSVVKEKCCISYLIQKRRTYDSSIVVSVQNSASFIDPLRFTGNLNGRFYSREVEAM
jgi:hypothetical protein